jgi:hypothetical protein
MVSQDRIFECLNAYRDGTKWKTPPVCAVCCQYSEKTDCIIVDEDIDDWWNFRVTLNKK